MPTYTKETALYDTGAIQGGINGAAQVATNYISADSTGIRIANTNPATATTYQHQTATETEFVVNNVSMTEIGGSGARVGAEDEGHVSIDSDGLGVWQNGDARVFSVSATGGARTVRDGYDTVANPQGYYSSTSGIPSTLTQTTIDSEVSTNAQIVFGQSVDLSDNLLLLGVSFDAVISETYSVSGETTSIVQRLHAGTVPIPVGDGTYTIPVSIEPYSNPSPYPQTITGQIWITYTFTDSTINMTFAMKLHWSDRGTGGTISRQVQACYIYFSLSNSHGVYTYHTERAPAMTMGIRGIGSGGIGAYSTALGEQVYASGDDQLAIGHYNIKDDNSVYAIVIGNGESDGARSNAATIDWAGNYLAQAMAGIIQMFAGPNPPAGWLICDGSAVSRTEYATLFAAIGTTWGTGDGSTTFNLPDLRGRAPIGAGSGSGLTARTLGDKSIGSELIQAHTHGFTNPSIPNHVHSMTHSHTYQYAGDSGANVSGSNPSGLGNIVRLRTDGQLVGQSTANYTGNSGNPTSLPATTGGSVGAVSGVNTGNGGNMQPSAVVNFIICTGKTY